MNDIQDSYHETTSWYHEPDGSWTITDGGPGKARIKEVGKMVFGDESCYQITVTDPLATEKSITRYSNSLISAQAFVISQLHLLSIH